MTGMSALQPPAALEAVHSRHHDVEQNDERLCVACLLDRTLGLAGYQDAVSLATEHLHQNLDVRGRVVDDENAVCSAHFAASACRLRNSRTAFIS